MTTNNTSVLRTLLLKHVGTDTLLDALERQEKELENLRGSVSDISDKKEPNIPIPMTDSKEAKLIAEFCSCDDERKWLRTKVIKYRSDINKLRVQLKLPKLLFPPLKFDPDRKRRAVPTTAKSVQKRAKKGKPRLQSHTSNQTPGGPDPSKMNPDGTYGKTHKTWEQVEESLNIARNKRWKKPSQSRR